MQPEAYISLKENDIDFELKKTIFWVGCGVSWNSGLPLGGPLTEEYLSVSLGTAYLSYVNKIWKKANKLFCQFYDIDTPIVRLEFVIGVIDEVDREFGGKRILQGFEHFHEMTPCENHLLLNALVAQAGAIIITPNFDSGISLNNGFRPNTPDNDVPTYPIGNSNIYHYHGTIFDIDNLGATIANIKNGFPAEFEKRLKNLLLDGYNIVCVGFSSSDYFDVTPFFDKLTRDLSEKQKKNLGQTIFFEYQSAKKDSLEKANRMLSAFSDRRYLYGDTTSFLREWASGLKINSAKRTSDFKWQKGFRDNIPKPHETKQWHYMIKMSNQLGLKLRNCMTKPLFKMSATQLLASVINEAERIDLGQHMLANFNRDPNKSAFTDALKYCRESAFSIDALEVYRRGANCYYRSRKDAKERDPFEVNQSNKSIKEIIDYMNSEDKNSWDEGFTIQSISYHIGEYMHDMNSGKYSPDDLYMLLNYINELRKKHFSEFLYMSYYTTLTKNKWRLEHLLEGKLPSEEELKEVLSISLEMSCISEATRILKAYIDILIRQAKRHNSIWLLIKAIKPAYILLRMHSSVLTKRIKASSEEGNEYMKFWG